MDIDVIVGNRRRGVPAGYGAVEVGRPSVLGNPFRVGAAFAQGEAAAAYLPYLRGECRSGGPVREAVLALACRAAAGERLACMCWCAPLPCHADHVAAAVRGYARVMLEGRQ